MLARFHRCQRVIIVGLKERDDLNGCEAHVVQHHQGRELIQLAGTGECIRVKPQNLAIAAPAGEERAKRSPISVREVIERHGKPCESATFALPPSLPSRPTAAAHSTRSICIASVMQGIVAAILLAVATVVGVMVGAIEKQLASCIPAPGKVVSATVRTLEKKTGSVLLTLATIVGVIVGTVKQTTESRGHHCGSSVDNMLAARRRFTRASRFSKY